MEKALVSVVIPVYQAEKYLTACLDSVLRQSWTGLEIILVDDGSTDGSAEICSGYAERFPQVKLISQPNLGQSRARDAGMRAASGKYLMFVDADDCLDGPEAVETLVREAEERQADITVGAFRRVSERGYSGIKRHCLRAGEYTETEDFRFKGFYMYGHLAYCWGKLYRRAFLAENGLSCGDFDYPFAEDKAFNMACCVCGPIYAFTDKSVYLYRENEESVTFRYKENFAEGWTAVAEDFNRLLADRGLAGDYGGLTAFHIFFGAFFLAKQELEFKERGITEAAKALRSYGETELARETWTELARGRYLRDISSRSWKLVIRCASAMFRLRAYGPMAFGTAVLRRLSVDKRITESRYK